MLMILTSLPKLFLFYLFFKFKFIYFNWRLITLQYCIGFAIHQQKTWGGYNFSTKKIKKKELNGEQSKIVFLSL